MTGDWKQSDWVKFGRAVLRYVVLVLMILVWAFPVIWVILTSFKGRTENFTIPPTIFFKPTLQHYIEALTDQDILPSIINSLILASGTTLITLLVAVPAGHAFSRVQFRLRHQAHSSFVLMAQMAPPIGLIIPSTSSCSIKSACWTPTPG